MGQFKPIASSEQSSERSQAEQWAFHSLTEKVLEAFAGDQVERWYDTAFAPLLSTCLEDVNQLAAELDRHLSAPVLDGSRLAVLEDARSALYPALAQLEDLQALSGRFVLMVSGLRTDLHRSSEQLSDLYVSIVLGEEDAAGPLSGSEPAVNLLGQASKLEDLLAGFREISNLADQAATGLYSSTHEVEQVLGAGALPDSFRSLPLLIEEFPAPDPEFFRQQVEALIEAADQHLLDPSASDPEPERRESFQEFWERMERAQGS